MNFIFEKVCLVFCFLVNKVSIVLVMFFGVSLILEVRESFFYFLRIVWE